MPELDNFFLFVKQKYKTSATINGAYFTESIHSIHFAWNVLHLSQAIRDDAWHWCSKTSTVERISRDLLLFLQQNVEQEALESN